MRISYSNPDPIQGAIEIELDAYRVEKLRKKRTDVSSYIEVKKNYIFTTFICQNCNTKYGIFVNAL